MALDDRKRAWLGQALGVVLPGGGRRPGESHEPLSPIWIRAKEQVDATITKLQRVLLATGDENMRAIAEFGLHGITQGQNVRLMVALREADSSGTPEALKRLAEAAEEYSDYLEGAPLIRALEDDNPFIKVPFRATLGPALKEIQRRAAA